MHPVITERNHGVVNSMFADEGVRNLTADEEQDRRASYFQNIESGAAGGSEGGGEGSEGCGEGSECGGGGSEGGGETSYDDSNHPAIASSDWTVPSPSSESAAGGSKALKAIAEGHILPKKIRIYDARGQQRNKDVEKAKGKRRDSKGFSAFDPNYSDTGTLEFNLVSESSGSDDDDDSGYDEGSSNGESGMVVALIGPGSKALRKKETEKNPTEAQPPNLDKDLAAAGEYFVSPSSPPLRLSESPSPSPSPAIFLAF